MKALVVSFMLAVTSLLAIAQTEEEVMAAFEESKRIAVKSFPDVTDPDSEMVQWMLHIDGKVEEENHPIFEHPYKPLILSIIAAQHLGITPKLTLLRADQLQVYEKCTEISNEVVRQISVTQEQSGNAAEPNDGLVPNPVLFMTDIDPIKKFAEYSAERRVTPARAREILAEKKAEKDQIRKDAQMKAILSDLDEIEQKTIRQQREINRLRLEQGR